MKVQIKSKLLSPFAGISFFEKCFNLSGLQQLIDNELGSRVVTIGYSYSDIVKNYWAIFFSGGNCAEDIQANLGKYFKSIPNNAVPSADTLLRGLKELATTNTQYTSASKILYDFNLNMKLNDLNIKSLLLTKQLEGGQQYDLDYDNQIIAT